MALPALRTLRLVKVSLMEADNNIRDFDFEARQSQTALASTTHRASGTARRG